MAHVGEILAELRNDRELSQKELGRVLHIGGGTISCYERGSSLPNSDRIAQIADYFHVTTDYLLGRTSYNISPDYLAEPICGEVTVHDLHLNTLLGVPAGYQILHRNCPHWTTIESDCQCKFRFGWCLERLPRG